MALARRPRRLRRASRSLIVIAVSGVMFSIGALLTVARPSSSSPLPAAPVVVATEYDMVSIPTPTRAIAKGERLSNVEFSEISWPKNRLSGAYIDRLDAYRNAVALTPLPKYLPIPTSAVSLDGGLGNEVVEGIPQGYRAITVRVDAESAVEGWARSGNFVDVIVVRASSDSTVGLEAKVIAENVRILSAGQSTAPLDSSGSAPAAPATVTLLTNQEDALKIKTAANLGKLTFALRGKDDVSPTASLAMNQKKLLGGTHEAAPSVDKDFKGVARGPDGKLYVLSDKRRWTRSSEMPSAFRMPADSNSAHSEASTVTESGANKDATAADVKS